MPKSRRERIREIKKRKKKREWEKKTKEKLARSEKMLRRERERIELLEELERLGVPYKKGVSKMSTKDLKGLLLIYKITEEEPEAKVPKKPPKPRVPEKIEKPVIPKGFKRLDIFERIEMLKKKAEFSGFSPGELKKEIKKLDDYMKRAYAGDETVEKEVDKFFLKLRKRPWVKPEVPKRAPIILSPKAVKLVKRVNEFTQQYEKQISMYETLTGIDITKKFIDLKKGIASGLISEKDLRAELEKVRRVVLKIWESKGK